jgi:hypothetical protein
MYKFIIINLLIIIFINILLLIITALIYYLRLEGEFVLIIKHCTVKTCGELEVLIHGLIILRFIILLTGIVVK